LGLIPIFKAGLHYGQVTTEEIGVIKKEIIFTRDVLNTTAGIEGPRNQFNVDMLISSFLVEKLHLQRYKIRTLGFSVLRGKDEQIELYTIENIQSEKLP